MKYLVSAALFAATFSTSAVADTIDVFENRAPGGDYANSLGAVGNELNPAPAGTTAVNVVGSLRCNDFPSCTGGLNDGFDAFYFTVGALQEVTQLTITSVGSPTFSLSAFLQDTMTDAQNSLTFGVNETVTFLSTSDAPLGQGRYNFGIGFEVGSGSTLFEADYTISATVRDLDMTPVPLPAGFPLLLAALGALGLLRKARKV